MLEDNGTQAPGQAAAPATVLDQTEQRVSQRVRDLLREGVEAVRLLGVREGHSHARGQRRVENHGGALKPRRQVHCGHRANALPVQDDVLRADAVSGNMTQSQSPTVLFICFSNKHLCSLQTLGLAEMTTHAMQRFEKTSIIACFAPSFISDAAAA